jgi:GT2 family glycosyltransferase
LPHADWLSRGVSHFRDQNVVAVTGPSNYYDWSVFFRRSALVIQSVAYVPIHYLLQATGRGAILIANNCFIRKSALDAVGGYNTSLTFWGDDTDTAQRLITRGKIIFDTTMPMDTSARRFKNFGTFRTLHQYITAFISTTRSGIRKNRLERKKARTKTEATKTR